MLHDHSRFSLSDLMWKTSWASAEGYNADISEKVLYVDDLVFTGAERSREQQNHFLKRFPTKNLEHRVFALAVSTTGTL